MGNLMTASLLDAYKWYNDAPSGNWKQKATNDLIAKIRREDKFEPNEAVTRGMNFEKAICQKLHLDKTEFQKECGMRMRQDIGADNVNLEIGKFWDTCHGGGQQAKVTGSIVVDGMEFYLFGFADVVHEDRTVHIS